MSPLGVGGGDRIRRYEQYFYRRARLKRPALFACKCSDGARIVYSGRRHYAGCRATAIGLSPDADAERKYLMPFATHHRFVYAAISSR